MKIDNLRNYSEAMKQALIMRRNGTIDSATDHLLGQIAYNIVRWAIVEMVQQLRIDTVRSNDPDFQSQCVLMVVTYFDRVNLDLDSTAIVVYLKKVAQSAARDQLMAATCGKRQHDDVDLDAVTIVSDFWGRKTSFNETALDY